MSNRPRPLIALMMEAPKTSETLVSFYQATRLYNQEDSRLRAHRRESLKSYYKSVSCWSSFAGLILLYTAFIKTL
jgi:hypothetical protein